MNWCFAIIIIAIAVSCVSQKKVTESGNGMIVTASGLKYMILKKGVGAFAKEGNEVLLYETTTYLNGTVLYSNENTDRPVKVLIGANQATKGVDEGLRGMQVGEVRKLILSPELARRTIYPDNLSPDSSIIVTIRLHSIL